MKNRGDALRELQARLAERLEAAGSGAFERGWLAVECAERAFLLPLAQCGEIFAIQQLTEVQHTRPWFVGVTNLRGVLHGVVDLGLFLGLRRGEAAREGGRVVTLGETLQVNAALRVDRLAGLRRPEQMTALAPHAGGSAPHFAAARWRDAEGRLWHEIDLAALAADENFLAIAA